MLSSQPPPPIEWWRYPETPRQRRPWGQIVWIALASMVVGVVAAFGLVVLAYAVLSVVATWSYGSNK
jgi:hypothetical protein